MYHTISLRKTFFVDNAANLEMKILFALNDKLVHCAWLLLGTSLDTNICKCSENLN